MFRASYDGGTSRKGRLAFFAAGMLAVFAVCPSCSNSSGKAKKPSAPPPVTVVKSEEKVLPLVFDTYGLVEPYAQISVKAKLTGKIMELGFKPGQKVKKGDLLVQIDPRPYEAELKMYKAQLNKNELLARDARRILGIKERLERSGSVTLTEMETQRATVLSAEAALEVDKALIESTLLNMEYCRILAPFDGVAGDILIHAGSIVKANDDTIAKFAQITPAYVAFSLPERMLPCLRLRQASGEKIEIEAFPPTSKLAPVKCELCFIDNAVDQASGTIKMKALYANADTRLWPGQYVDVKVELSQNDKFVTVPSDAVMAGQGGQQVFVLKDDSTVELKPVQVERSYDGLTAVKGLDAGETVVLTGQFRLAPGVKASVKEPIAKASGSAAGK